MLKTGCRHIDEKGHARDGSGEHLAFADVPHLALFIDYRPIYRSPNASLTSIVWKDGHQMLPTLKDRAIILLPLEIAAQEAA